MSPFVPAVAHLLQGFQRNGDKCTWNSTKSYFALHMTPCKAIGPIDEHRDSVDEAAGFGGDSLHVALMALGVQTVMKEQCVTPFVVEKTVYK
ncbi:hypothetical protein PI125_g432 [Phytophthora idaei]|nr:hypothetical protein PI125_g432 [Phytophthora idaei]